MNRHFKKYKINTVAMIMCIIIFSVFTAIFITFISLSNIYTIDQVGIGTYNVFLIIKDISLIGMTVFGSSLISTILIDRKTKDDEYFFNIVNEVICDPRIYASLSDSNRRLIEGKVLECEHETQIDIIKDVIAKIKNFDFYYDECTINVSCLVVKDVCKKTISKMLKIKSFGKECVKSEYIIHSSATRETGDDYLKIKSVSVNDKVLSQDEDYLIRRENVSQEERVLLRNGYKSRYQCVLKKPLSFSSDQSTTIFIEYETKVSNDDFFTNRLPGPCKKYRLSFGVSDGKNSKFDINASAFGFMEKGIKTPNIDENRFEIIFDTWSFKDDGVSLSYKKKTKK